MRTNVLATIHGIVEVARSESGAWTAAQTNQVLFPANRVRTGERSRAVIYLANGMTIHKSEFSEYEIPPSQGITFKSGFFQILNRLKISSEFRLPGANGAIRGTDFLVRVDGANAEVIVLDGEVTLTNAAGGVALTNKEMAVIENGGAPRKTSVVQAVNDLIQWFLYYPGILNVDELPFTAVEAAALGNSIKAYRVGDLLEADRSYSWQAPLGSDADRALRASLLLNAGQVDKAKAVIQGSTTPAARAINKLIAAIKFQAATETNQPVFAAEWLAESYYRQSRFQLNEALEAARAATTNAPGFGLAWARVAELEFGFGRTAPALEALEKSLELSPRNAQAIALKGFLLAAKNKTTAAIAEFDRAIDLDSALGNAWLGRGLCLFHKNRSEEGLRDLHVAAALEPQRSVLRSYLGKAFAEVGDSKHARRELLVARELDENDPTSWLYSALLNQQSNRINEAVSELERSSELNDNRRLFRSTQLLDQDRAVRSANLAGIYRDAGMFEVSLREASRAVGSDYANYSSHLFLANSYNELSDPNLVNLRYETATFSEYLLANLLAPVGASTLSRNVSQQEYSKLFERDHLGLSSSSTYLSNGDWQQEVSQFGTIGNTAYALDGIYRSFNGQRANNELEQTVLSAQFKQQLTIQDSVYFQAIFNDFESGDLRQYYNNDGSANVPGARPSRGLHVTEKQEPNLFFGFHHEWSPGMHTLFLAGKLNDRLHLHEPAAVGTTLFKDFNTGNVIDRSHNPEDRFNLSYNNKLDAYSVELQQIWQTPKHIVIAGGRFQPGEIESKNLLDYTTNLNAIFFRPIYNDPAARRTVTTDLERANVYGYYNWQPFETLWLNAGVSYDHLDFPRNASSPPVSGGQSEKDQISPKGGFIWTPADSTSFRGAYTRSLGGLFFDQSVRLEPTLIAGFNQAYRSLFPEALIGPVAGSEFETFQLGLDHKFAMRTYVVAEAALLKSEASRALGVFDYFESAPGFPKASPSTTRQKLNYEERSLTVSVNQLVGDCWSFGSRYRLSEGELDARLPQVPNSVLPDTHDRAVLHQLNLFAIYNHPTGFFSKFETLWWSQSNHEDSSALPGDDFWQFNVFAGYRFPRRRAEIIVGVLNLTDEDYRLNPLNLYGELPRDRTLVANLKFNF